MLEWLSAGPAHWPALLTLLSSGAPELALRLRQAIRPGELGAERPA
jgi:hypothetical protein